MALNGWDTRPNGDIAVVQTLGWQTAIMPLNGLIRLNYAETEQQFESGGVALQLVLTPVQLRQLSADLLKMAELIDAQNLGTPQ